MNQNWGCACNIGIVLFLFIYLFFSSFLFGWGGRKMRAWPGFSLSFFLYCCCCCCCRCCSCYSCIFLIYACVCMGAHAAGVTRMFRGRVCGELVLCVPKHAKTIPKHAHPQGKGKEKASIFLWTYTLITIKIMFLILTQKDSISHDKWRDITYTRMHLQTGANKVTSTC